MSDHESKDAAAQLKSITSFVEYLSASYAAMGLYGPEHPLVTSLTEAVADGLPLKVMPCTLQISCGSFLWQQSPVPPKLVSQLASDLHALNVVEMCVTGTAKASAVHSLLSSVYQARQDGSSVDDVLRVAGEISGCPFDLIPLSTEALSSRAVLASGARSSDGALLSDAELAALLRHPPEDPVTFADQIMQHVESGDPGDTDEIRAWLLSKADAVAGSDTDASELRRAWLETCVQRLTPAVRAQLLRAVPQPDPEWLLSAARLAPVWPIDELLGALENLAGDVTSLRGTGRLLFAQLLGLAQETKQQQRVRSIIETWGANRPDSSLFLSGAVTKEDDHFRGEDYAEELLLHAARRVEEGDSLRFDFDDGDEIDTRAAEIAITLAEESGQNDLAAVGVSRVAESLIRQQRTDLVVRALTHDLESEDGLRSLSRHQQRLMTVLRKPDCIRALLDCFATASSDAGVVRILDLAGEHAASLALDFAATTVDPNVRMRALAWVRSLPSDVRASAIGEHLSASPEDVDMLEPVCDGIEAFQIGHCVEHLVSGDQPVHTRAVLRLLGWCRGAWPASVVHHVISTPQKDVVDEAVRSLTAGPAHSRSDTIARVLCSLVSLRHTPVVDLRTLIDVLKQDQRVAERAFVDVLAVIRTRPSRVTRGDAIPILEALAGYRSIGEATRRAMREWKSPSIRLLSLIGRVSGSQQGRRRSA